MKYIYKITYILLVFSLLLNTTSCTLEHEINDKINTAIFPANEQDVKSLLNANVYNLFAATWGRTFCPESGYVLLSDVSTEQIRTSWWGCEWASHEADDGILNSYNFYSRFSKYLAAMTLTIDRIKDVPMPSENLDRYTAELKCGLGWLSFMLYDMYGTIPVADLETLKNPLDEKILPRLSKEDMIKYIETNLIEAATVLPYKYGDADYGRFTKGLANTVLLKLYMHSEEWAKAEAIGRELIKAEYGYVLVNDYYSLFTLAGEKNSEVIFSAVAKSGIITHGIHAMLLTGDFPTDVPNMTKYDVIRMTWPFFDTYDPTDLRRKRIVTEYIGDQGVEHSREIDNMPSLVLYRGPVYNKYGHEGTIGGSCEIDIPIYRYADVLGLLAEAIVRNGNAVTGEAISLVNQVRVTHGGLPPFSSFSSVEDFLDALLLERGHEFAFEGVRRQDLIRHGKYIEAMVKKNVDANRDPAKVNTMVDGEYKYELFPIPPTIINEGKGIIKQNPGF